MNPQQPMALRPLALITLAVVGAHALLLSTSLLLQAPQPTAAMVMLTRSVSLLPETPMLAAAPVPVHQEKAETLPPRPAPRVPPLPARAITSSAPAASASLIDTPPASPQTAPAMRLAIPGPVRLTYAVTGQSRGRSFATQGQLSWRHDGSDYEASLAYAAPLHLSRSQSSSGRITAEGLTPQRFSDRTRSEQATHFERDKGMLVFSSNAPQQPLPAGAQDRLSVILQLAAMLAAEPARFPAGTEITLQTVGTRDAQAWLFTVEGDETLELPGGQVATRKLVRQPRGEYDIRIELWLGTGMDYVPVRLRLTQPNGDFVDQQWASTDRS
jgi:hypothetical protein